MKNPELRFKNDIDNWEEQPIVNILQYEQPQKYIVNDDNYINSGIPVLTANNGFVLGYTNENRVHSGECIIFDDFTMDSKYVNFDFMVKSSAMKILTCRENDNLKLLFEIFQKMKFESFGHSRHYISVVQPTNIKLPKLEIQSQIATLLSDIDTKIETQEQKVEKLKIFKSAMLDKMFPKEGQKVSEIRFDGFSGDWEEKILIENCDYVDYRGKTPNKRNNGIFLVTAKNIRMGYIDYECSKEYISYSDYDEVMHRGLPKKGDVLITTEAPCGNIAQIDDEHIALAQRVIKYSGKENINNNFLKNALMHNSFQKKLEECASGGTVRGIKASILHSLSFICPPTIEEQEKIGKYFEELDNKIELETSKLNKLKDIKNAMLNKLLP